jgi:PhnB protein
MQLNVYLQFNGQCEAAFKFYEQCLGGKTLALFKYAGSPMDAQVPPDWRQKIMHARLVVGNNTVMGCDAPPEQYKAPKGFSMSIGIKDPAEAQRIFDALREKGTVTMPLQQTFWAERFGMLVDQFGIPWMINCGPEV